MSTEQVGFVEFNAPFQKRFSLIRLEQFLGLDLRHQFMFTICFSKVLPSGKKSWSLIVNNIFVSILKRKSLQQKT
jgi:hypothetical protein